MVPEGWEEKPLSEIVSKGSPIVYGIVQAGPHIEDGLPYIKSSDVGGKIDISKLQKTSFEIAEKYKRAEVHPNDLVFSLRGNIGELSIVPINIERANLTQGTARIRVNSKSNSIYINYALQSYQSRKRIDAVTKGSTFKEISLEELRKVLVPLPPLPEQQKIADILSTWDKAIEKQEALIAAKQKRKRGLMQQLLTGKVRFMGFEGEEWSTNLLGNLGNFSKGKGIAKKDLKGEGLCCVRYGEIYTVHHDVIKTYHSYIDLETADQSKEIFENDILFAGSGETREDIGKCVAKIDSIKAYAGGDIIIFSPKNATVDSAFLTYLLNSVGRKQLDTMGTGHSVVHIYSKDLVNLEINLPPLPEQQKIASVLSAADKEI
jgi:type I restriction enzyme S subunit